MGELDEFFPALIAHTLAGVALALLVWLAGLGAVATIARLFGRRAEPVDAPLAYAHGLLLVLVAALLVLVNPVVGGFGLLLVAVAVVLAFRDAALLRAVWRDAWPSLAAATPALLAFPIVLGAFYHGPTETLTSHAFGDLTTYVARLASARNDVLQFPDLLTYPFSFSAMEIGPSLLGGAASKAVAVDPFFLHTATLPAQLMASLAIGLGVTFRSREDERQSGAMRDVWVLTIGLLFVAGAAYPTWLADSPPVSLALPLVFTVAALVTRRLGFGEFLVHSSVVGLALPLTKILAAPAFVAALATTLVERNRESLRRHWMLGTSAVLIPLIVAAVLVANTGLWTLVQLEVRFEPKEALEGLARLRGETNTHDLFAALLDLGAVILAVALWRARELAAFAALVTALACHWLVFGAVFYTAVGCALALAALVLRPRADQRDVVALAVVAAVLVGTAAWLRDVAQLPASFTMWALFVLVPVLALWGALESPRGLFRRLALVTSVAGSAIVLAVTGRSYAAYILAAAAALAAFALRGRPRAVAGVAVVAVVVGVAAALRGDDPSFGDYVVVLQPDDYVLWRTVEDRVPPDGIIFTSLTGPTEAADDEGWNYYPGVGRRQLYLAGWINSPLFTDEAELRRHLAANAAVLNGRTPADRVAPGFESYWAVTRTGERLPPGAQPVERIGRYRLSRLRDAP